MCMCRISYIIGFLLEVGGEEGGEDIKLWANYIPSDLRVYAPTKHPKIYMV